MGGLGPIKGGETKEIRREEKRKREMVVEARGGWGGHATQIGPPLVPICGPCDPQEKRRGGADGGQGEGRGRGVAAGQGG